MERSNENLIRRFVFLFITTIRGNVLCYFKEGYILQFYDFELEHLDITAQRYKALRTTLILTYNTNRYRRHTMIRYLWIDMNNLLLFSSSLLKLWSAIYRKRSANHYLLLLGYVILIAGSAVVFIRYTLSV